MSFTIESSNIYDRGSGPAEMISNGTLDSATGWTTSANITISGGVANVGAYADETLGQSNANMISPIQESTEYDFKISVNTTSVYIYIQTYDGLVDLVVGYQLLSVGENTFTFTTGVGIENCGIQVKTVDPVACQFDNLSLKLHV